MAKCRPTPALRLVGRRGGQPGRLDAYVTDLANATSSPTSGCTSTSTWSRSPNYGLFVYDGDGSGFGLVGPDGSDDIEALFEQFFADRDIPSEPTAFSGRSDYQAFINNGIPAGGLFTGAEGIKTAEQAAVGRRRRPRLRPLLPPGLRHDRQPQPRGATHQRRCHRLRDLPGTHPARRRSPPTDVSRTRGPASRTPAPLVRL